MARIETPKRIRGTQDIFGDEQRRFARVLAAFDHVRRLYGFQRVEIPVFEATAVFGTLARRDDRRGVEGDVQLRGSRWGSPYAPPRIHRRHRPRLF